MALTKIGATLGGSADVIQVTQSSHGLSLGFPVKVSGNGTYAHATADSAANAEAIGIIIATTTDTMTIALGGRITVDGVLPSGNPAAGTVLFMATSAGKLTATPPTGNNQVVKPMAVVTYLNSEMIMLQHRGEVISTAGITLADGSVDNDAMADDAINTDEIVNDAVTADKLANSINTAIAANTAKVTIATHTGDVTGATTLTIATDAVDIAMLSATGTASSSTFLRGDNSWAAASSALSTKRVYTSYIQGTTNDPQTISGAGFQPTKVEIIAATGGTSGGSSIGHSDSSNSEFCTSLQSNGYYGARDGRIVHISNGTWALHCTCTINSDGCVLDWTAESSGWATIYLSVMFSR